MSDADNKSTKTETEGVRDLITPDTQQAAIEESDRSPKKTERDEIIETAVGADQLAKTMRDKVTPESLAQLEAEGDGSSKQDADQ